jgi:hypothetical protein
MKDSEYFKNVILQELRQSDIFEEEDVTLAYAYVLTHIFADLEKQYPELVRDLEKRKDSLTSMDLTKEIPFFEMSFDFYLKDFMYG